MLAKQEEEAAKKRADLEARQKAADEAKKAAEPKDEEMKDTDEPVTEETVE